MIKVESITVTPYNVTFLLKDKKNAFSNSFVLTVEETISYAKEHNHTDLEMLANRMRQATKDINAINKLKRD